MNVNLQNRLCANENLTPEVEEAVLNAVKNDPGMNIRNITPVLIFQAHFPRDALLCLNFCQCFLQKPTLCLLF